MDEHQQQQMHKSPPKLHNLDEHLSVLNQQPPTSPPKSSLSLTHRSSLSVASTTMSTIKRSTKRMLPTRPMSAQPAAKKAANVSIAGSDGKMYKGSLDSEYLTKLLSEQAKRQQDVAIHKQELVTERKHLLASIKIPEQRLLSPATDTTAASPNTVLLE